MESRRKDNPRAGTTGDGLRLTERWTSSARCVFQFDCQGSVAKSTHAGIPWLRWLRRHASLKKRVHFWPFDGLEPPSRKSVIAEVYPSIFRNRFPRHSRNVHEQDAYATAQWMREMDDGLALLPYFEPPLNDSEERTARREGWILGIA